MRYHRTFTKASGLNREASASEVRNAVETYLNQLHAEHTIIAITESWTVNSRFDLTLWIEWNDASPLPPVPDNYA
jgi:hypothetical protein